MDRQDNKPLLTEELLSVSQSKMFKCSIIVPDRQPQIKAPKKSFLFLINFNDFMKHAETN